YTFKKDEGELTLLSDKVVKVKLKQVTGILRNAQDEALRKRWQEQRGKRATRDRVLVLKAGILNPLEGTLGEPDAKGEEINFKLASGGASRALPFKRIHGLIFNRLNPETAPAVCEVHDVHGDT